MLQQTILNKIISEYATPAYVFDETSLIDRIRQLRSHLPKELKLCYAMKANPFLTKTMSRLTDRLEVCSPGEYEVCIREHIDPSMIVVSGVNKTMESMSRIFLYSNGAGIYTVESPAHYDILKTCAANAGVRINILLRLSSGNQFGMDKPALLALLKSMRNEENVNILGIHFYGGTQKTYKKMQAEISMLAELGTELNRLGFDNLEMEYGPGLYVPYFKDDNNELMKPVNELSQCLPQLNMYPNITIELGRYLAAFSGYYITRVMDVKHTNNSHYLIVDGGIHQINYYGQMLGMKLPYIRHIRSDIKADESASSDIDWTVCGSLCTANDILVRKLRLESPSVSDMLVFERCGAYSITEGMALFLSRELPQVLLVGNDGTIEVMRRLTDTYPFNDRSCNY